LGVDVAANPSRERDLVADLERARYLRRRW
jgi:hypothetical protein